MTVSDALRGITHLGVDTSPFIFYVEDNRPYADLCEPIFARVADGRIAAHTSVLTITETLVHPIRNTDAALCDRFRVLLLDTDGLTTWPVDADIAQRAAELRARYRLRTPDAIQIATALQAGCNAFLTNDLGLKRVTELRILVLDELTV